MASKQLKRILTAGIFPLLALASCIGEKEIYPRSGDGGTEITFSIMLPGKSAPASRAMTEGQENEVAYMDILAFEPGGNYVYTARCSGSEIMTDGGNMRKKSFTVKLRQGTFDLVLLANAREQTVSGGSFAGKDKAAVLALIEAEMPVSGKWPADGSRPIPMWGEKNGVTINESTNLKDEEGVSLARMIARVDVQITGTATGTFELASVHVYNYNTHGSVAPATGQWNPGGPDFEANPPKATAPNVPSSSTLTEGPLLYNGTEVTATGCASEIYIFEAENHTTSAHTTAMPQLSRTCLVVGGVYDANGNGIFTDDGLPTYYRVDFSTGSGAEQKFLDVLRNHQYIFSITKVSGAGYETPQIAFESLPVNIEANVLQWNEAEFSEIKFDGQYMLGISPASVFDFFKSSETQSASIKTTYPGGWKVLKITESNADGNTETDISTGGWLTTDKTTGSFNGSDGNYTSLDIIVSDNTTGSDRTGYIYIQAGKLETRLTVKQSTTVPSMLVATDANDNSIDALEFSGPVGTALTPQTFKVQWAPKNETLYISTSPVAMPAGGSYTPISWSSYKTESGAINNTGAAVYVTPISNGSGYVKFTVQPNAITSTEMGGDPFYERAIQVNFRATGGEGLMRKGLLLQQYVYNMQATAESFYLADGSKYTFNVKSNRPWKAYLIDNGSGMVESPAFSTATPIATGGYNLPNGVNVEFKTFDDLSNPTIFTGTAKVRIEWLKGEDPSNEADWDKSTVVDLFCASGEIREPSNCYVVQPNSMPILIPVERANGLLRFDLDEDNNPTTPIYQSAGWTFGKPIADYPGTTNYNVELLWTEKKGANNTGYDPVYGNTPIKLLLAVGNNSKGYVLVMPGSEEGNSLIALTIGTGADKVKWSWHIWNTSYVPPADANTGTIMDRHVGALDNKLSGYKQTWGMYFQWGRKDPLPNTYPVFTSTTSNAVFANNASTSPSISIQKPMEFMSGTWYGTISIAGNNDSWGQTSGVKTVYDPCPEGWKVPLNIVWNGLTNATFTVEGTQWAQNQNGNTGKRNDSYGGFYPSSGYIQSAGSVNMGMTGFSGYCWSATSLTSTSASSLYFLQGSTATSGNNGSRYYAFPVRCVKE